MQDAETKAANYAGYVECYINQGLTATAAITKEITMTDATEAIWGSSGRGNPNAVRVIEAVAMLGYLRIRKVGKRKRMVSRTDKPIPESAFSAEDRKFASMC